MSANAGTEASLDLDLVRAEWPRQPDRSLYFNTGSCGRKPQRVLTAINDGWEKLNHNPTYWTFLAEQPVENARRICAGLLGILPESLLLTQNTTAGLQLVLQSFLLKPGDEFVTTTHEHGSTNAIARYLEETRGIIVKRHHVEPMDGSEALCDGLLSLVNERTRLVQVSEISSACGWRPNLQKLAERLRGEEIPLLVDGAHTPGQGPLQPSLYPFWVGSGHKWLCAPNGTGFLYVHPDWVHQLRPVWLSDRYYNEFQVPLQRFEFPGTWDVVRWMALAVAAQLNMSLGLPAVAARQAHLVTYLRGRLAELDATIRTPDVDGETTGILTATWSAERVHVANLRDHLWDVYKIWTQPDFFFGQEGNGLRFSCHISLEEKDIDRLIEALHHILG